jgi:transitional endoplasmic reticulum ATPase
MIYTGKAFQIQFRDSDGDLISFISPKPLDVIAATMPHFNQATKDRIEVEVLDVLRKKDMMRQFGIPLKKGFLLAATYGMGKTLLGRYVARIAVENGWTFIYVTSAAELPEAYALARNYMPAVVFVEDINRVVGQSRNQQVDRILNILDGVDSKDDEIIVAMTTNDPEEIHPALLRPGRVDSIIRIDSFDQNTVEMLLRQYAGDSLAKGCRLTKVSKRLEGQSGARIAHVVKQSKIYALHHLEGDTLQITEEDLLQAADVSILEAKRIDEEYKERGMSIVPVILNLLSANPELMASYTPHSNGSGEKIH